jgi:hypothetical protein
MIFICKSVHHVQEELALDPSDPLYRTFNKIFQAFKISEPVPEPVVEEKEEVKQIKQSDIISKSAMVFSFGFTWYGRPTKKYHIYTKISLNSVRRPAKEWPSYRCQQNSSDLSFKCDVALYFLLIRTSIIFFCTDVFNILLLY